MNLDDEQIDISLVASLYHSMAQNNKRIIDPAHERSTNINYQSRI